MAAKVRGRLSVSTLVTKKLAMEGYDLKELII
jgi:hypothetical protein